LPASHNNFQLNKKSNKDPCNTQFDGLLHLNVIDKNYISKKVKTTYNLMKEREQYFYTVEVKELQLQCYPPTAFEFDDMFIEVTSTEQTFDPRAKTGSSPGTYCTRD
jgi:hypothetical protein